MNTTTVEPAALRAWTEGRTIFLELTDGRIFGFPASRFARLKSASDEALKQVRVEVNGYALRWKNSTKTSRCRAWSRPFPVAAAMRAPIEGALRGQRYAGPTTS